jgi:hypothetical protein
MVVAVTYNRYKFVTALLLKLKPKRLNNGRFTSASETAVRRFKK